MKILKKLREQKGLSQSELISPKKSDDVVPGQREIDVDSSEVVGEESYSFNNDQLEVKDNSKEE